MFHGREQSLGDGQFWFAVGAAGGVVLRDALREDFCVEQFVVAVGPVRRRRYKVRSARRLANLVGSDLCERGLTCRVVVDDGWLVAAELWSITCVRIRSRQASIEVSLFQASSMV